MVGTCGVHPLGLTVSNARAGDSWHNYKRAFDVVFLTATPGTISWTGPWEDVGKEGEDLGMIWGGRWKVPDRPHFEYHPMIDLTYMKARGKPLKVLDA